MTTILAITSLLLLTLTTVTLETSSHSWVVSIEGKTLGRSRGGITHAVSQERMGTRRPDTHTHTQNLEPLNSY